MADPASKSLLFDSSVEAEHSFETSAHVIGSRLGLVAAEVAEMIRDAARALEQHSEPLARQVVSRDASVNRAEVDIERHCLRILANEEPTSASLRFVIRAMRSASELERIADSAVALCELMLSGGSVMAPAMGAVAAILQAATRGVTDAFVERDDAKARLVLESIDEVDRLCRQRVEEHVRQDAAPMSLRDVLLVVGPYEHMGRRCRDLAEQVLHMVADEGDHGALRRGADAADAWPEDFRECLGAWPEEIERPLAASTLGLRDPFE